LVVSGGAGIQGNVNVGGNTIISGEVCSGDANVDGNECCWERGYLRECYAYLWDEFGSAGSYQGDDGVIQFNFGALVVSGGRNTRKRECWRALVSLVIWTEW
jgi:hypothetical protein